MFGEFNKLAWKNQNGFYAYSIFEIGPCFRETGKDGNNLKENKKSFGNQPTATYAPEKKLPVGAIRC